MIDAKMTTKLTWRQPQNDFFTRDGIVWQRPTNSFRGCELFTEQLGILCKKYREKSPFSKPTERGSMVLVYMWKNVRRIIAVAWNMALLITNNASLKSNKAASKYLNTACASVSMCEENREIRISEYFFEATPRAFVIQDIRASLENGSKRLRGHNGNAAHRASFPQHSSLRPPLRAAAERSVRRRYTIIMRAPDACAFRAQFYDQLRKLKKQIWSGALRGKRPVATHEEWVSGRFCVIVVRIRFSRYRAYGASASWINMISQR